MKLYITPNDSAVEATVNDIKKQQPILFTDFEAMRDWVASHISYRYDKDVHSVDNYWQLPSETLALGTGDCEDFAILLCSLLRAYGVPADQVYVAVGASTDSLHAYLVEKWYQGVWRVTEPQAGAWMGALLSDWETSASYNTLYCFNDQTFLNGPPSLPSGVYEFEVGLSFYPLTRGASVALQRNLNAVENVTATLEWIKDYAAVNDWSLYVYAPNGNTIFSWSGKDLKHSFSFTATASGKYSIEILKRDAVARYARLTVRPTDWTIQLNFSPPTTTVPPPTTNPPSTTTTPAPTTTPAKQRMQLTMPGYGMLGCIVSYTRVLNAGDKVSGFVDLTGQYYSVDWSYQWRFQILDPSGKPVYDKTYVFVSDMGKNHYDFNFTASSYGTYKIVVTHWSNYSKNLVIEVQPTGWGKS